MPTAKQAGEKERAVKRFRVVLLALTLAFSLAPTSGALANPGRRGASVVDGAARFQIITPTLIRMEYAADGRFEDRPTFNAGARGLRPPPFSVRTTRSGLEIRTARLELRYTPDASPLGPGNVSVWVDGRTVRPQFGSPARPDALGGWYRGLDYYPGQAGSVDQIKLHQGLLTRQGWYLLDDSTTALRTADGWVQPRPAHGGAYEDGYFFGYGTDYKTALKDLLTLTGRPVLLPKWAFGNWFSKYFAYSFDDYRTQLLPAFRANRVPLDVLVADTDWKAPNTWAGWNWNPALFPNPQAFLDWAKAEHLQTTLNVHAAISEDDPRYAHAQEIAGGKLAPARSSFAPKPHRFDWADRDQAAAWQWLHDPFEAQGVRQWWLDYCCDDSTVSTPGLTPDSWVNELYRRDGDARGLRGFSLARIGASFPDYNSTPAAGPWGEHRSTVHFTGDTQPDWATLAFEAAFTPAEGSIGEPYVSHDIGSFSGKHLPEDLYVRWLQFGVFQPVNRLHSDHGDRLPWEYGDAVRGAAASFLRLREAMVPYLYATARQAYDSGLPMARALYLDYPREAGAYTHDTEYLLGDQLLVAPVTTPGLTAQTTVWLPPGTWTDVFTGATYQGPGDRLVVSTPERMPVFARSGAIVPLAAYADNVASLPNALTLKVFPHGSGATSLYEDAGEGLGYQRGQSASTPVRYTEHRHPELQIGPARGSYPGEPATRDYTAVFVDVTRPHDVTIDGRRAAFTYDAATQTLSVPVAHVAAHRRVVVEHDGRPVVDRPDPAVTFTLDAPDGLTAGQPGRVVATVTNHGPQSVHDVSVAIPAPAGWTVVATSPTTRGTLAAGDAFQASFTVTPAGSASNSELVATATYRNPDGSRSSLPASLAIKPRPVAVTFRVRVPDGMPPGDAVYLPGSIDQLGPWDPGKLRMTDKGGGIWEATITVLDGTEIQYKYTRGSWETVEWWGDITGTTNRSVTVNGGTDGTMVVEDTSTAWDDHSIPDIHKAVRYWRDAVVASTRPANGSSGPAPAAVTVTFQTDVRPTGADFGNAVTVTRGGAVVAGSVAETSPGVLTWTPAAALAPGTYDVTVDNVQRDIGGDAVPMRQPYRFSFTVT
jgi:hypothetical protein